MAKLPLKLINNVLDYDAYYRYFDVFIWLEIANITRKYCLEYKYQCTVLNSHLHYLQSTYIKLEKVHSVSLNVKGVNHRACRPRRVYPSVQNTINADILSIFSLEIRICLPTYRLLLNEIMPCL